MGNARYEHAIPQKTLLYQLVERHWPEFKVMLSGQGKQLPGYVVREFGVIPAIAAVNEFVCGWTRAIVAYPAH